MKLNEKGINPMVSYLLVLLLGITITGIVFFSVIPFIQLTENTKCLEQTIIQMNKLNKVIEEIKLVQEAEKNIELQLCTKLNFDAENNKIISRYNVNNEFKIQNFKREKVEINRFNDQLIFSINYETIDFDNNLSLSAGIHSIKLKNNGFSKRKTVIKVTK